MSLSKEAGLGTGLKQRRVTIMLIAGIIGASLFVGSGHAIAATDPAALIAHAITGTGLPDMAAVFIVRDCSMEELEAIPIECNVRWTSLQN